MDIFDSWIAKTPVAHRGLHNDKIPENSLASFKNAIKKGYAIELDLSLISDGTIVVFHDEKLVRMTGANGYLKKLTLEELKKLRLNGTKEQIPTFEETLKCVAGRVPLLIEIKNMNKVGFEKDVWKILQGYKGEYAVQSFNPYSLEWFKLNAPQVKRGQLSCFFKREKINLVKRYVLKRMKLNNVSEPNFIAYDLKSMPNRYLKKYHDIPILAWTAKTEADLAKAQKLATNVIFSGIEPEVKK